MSYKSCKLLMVYLHLFFFLLIFIVKNKGQMSFEGFARYMFSPECLLFKEKCKTVYQDMNQPLNDYFISSSHNTYLISDQLVGQSDIWGYVRYLF